MKKFVISGVLFISIVSITGAQAIRDWPVQDFMNFTVNPAMTVEHTNLSVGLTHGRKWRQIQSSPTQSNLGVVIPFRDQKMSIGSQIFSEGVGPFSTVGALVSYGYKFHISKSQRDELALGLSARFMHVKFDQDHFISSQPGDNILDGVEGNQFVPPSFSVGFSYNSGDPEYGNPVQMRLAGSLGRFLPFEDRFNTVSFDRVYQWYGLAGLDIYASEYFRIRPSLLVSAVEQRDVNYGFRIKAEHQRFGWLMAQYTKAGFLITQLGVNIKLGSLGDRLQLSASNGWFFGTVSGQLGNSFTFGIIYHRASSKNNY